MYFDKYLQNYVSNKNVMPLAGKLKASAFRTCKFDFCVTSIIVLYPEENRADSCRKFYASVPTTSIN